MLLMLTKTETEYLENIEAFEDTHGLRYAKVVRSRIRKRVEQALKDLIYIIEKDASRRRPAENYRSRNRHCSDYTLRVTSQDINAFKRRSGGNTEKKILSEDDLLIEDFLQTLARKNPYDVYRYKKILDHASPRQDISSLHKKPMSNT